MKELVVTKAAVTTYLQFLKISFLFQIESFHVTTLSSKIIQKDVF